MIPYSVLDLAFIVEGGDAGRALRNSLALAQHCERLGYRRFWLAEHHNMTGVASAATAVAIGYVAGGTSTIRVGAGGIMLPNHAPLVIAEQFGTLETLYPGRIDLGLGRAPGTDPLTTRALRRHHGGGPDTFPDDVQELMGYFEPAAPGQAVRAVPGAGLRVPIWILGSSLFGAQLAAALGLPYAFAAHFAPGDRAEAAALYRRTYRPSLAHPRPYVALAVNVFAGETDEEASLYLTSLEQAFVRLRLGRPGPLPKPSPGFRESLPRGDRAMLDGALACTVVGGKATLRERLLAFVAREGPDELIVSSPIFDHEARLRSFAATAAALSGTPT